MVCLKNKNRIKNSPVDFVRMVAVKELSHRQTQTAYQSSAQ